MSKQQTEEYELREEYDRVIRAGLGELQAGETVELTQEEAGQHSEFLEPTGGN